MNDAPPPDNPDVPEPTEVPPGQPVDASDAPRLWGDWSSRGFRASVATLLAVALVVVLGVAIQPPKVIITPGDATPVAPAITISGAPTYRSVGRVLFLTVYVSNHRPTLFELAAAELDGDAEIVDEREILGKQTRKQNDRIDQLLMSEAQAAAKTAALRRLGYQVPLTGAGVRISSVVPNGPSAGKLRDRDIITGLDGATVSTFEDLGRGLEAVVPGTTVTVQVTRDNIPLTVSVTTANDGTGRAIIGILGYTSSPRYTYPVDITIDPGNVSGPSAGLAFALGIVDDMTPGDLFGGKKIAVTGTIGPDGAVGAVGGVKQKTVTAKNVGASLLIVPAGEVADARAAGVDIPIVGVTSLDGALAALVAAGGTPIPNP